MKNLNKSQWFGICAGVAVVGFLFYGNFFTSLFMPNNTNANAASPSLATGFKVLDTTVGTGSIAAAGDTITLHYVGTLTDGKVFDSSVDRGTPFTFVLGVGSVIKGFDQGLLGMHVGGKRRLTIAPDFGYGNKAVGPIPANSTLIFDVELLNVTHPKAK